MTITDSRGQNQGLLTLRGRLNELLEERDRNFPRRDPANTAALDMALESYVRVLRGQRDPAWRPHPTVVAGARGMAENAVFICGWMKSGTTLVVGLLDGHPELTVVPGDSHMMNLISQQRRLLSPERVRDWDHHWIAHLVNPFGQRPFWFLGEDDRAHVEFMEYLDHWLVELPAGDRDPFLAAVLALHCVNPKRAARPKAWVEKTPGNEFQVREILGLYPSARFIHVIRDPLLNAASIKQLCLYRGWRWSAAAAAWRIRRSVRSATRNQQSLGRDRYHTLRYEHLVSHPDAEMRKIGDFLGISWDESLLKPTSNGVQLDSNSMYPERRVRGEILSVPSDRWRRDLTWAEQVAVRAIVYGTARQDADHRSM